MRRAACPKTSWRPCSTYGGSTLSDRRGRREHELQRRLDIIVDQGRLTAKQAGLLHEAEPALVDDRVIKIIPRTFYAHQEAVARRRVPRDPNDWPPVALALTLDIGILTGDPGLSRLRLSDVDHRSRP